jgi:hypothetical protein
MWKIWQFPQKIDNFISKMSKKSPMFEICNLCLSADKPTKGIFRLGLKETILFVCEVQVRTVGPLVL